MTTDEALEYCKKNQFHIYFVKIDDKTNIYHISTPRWYAESPQGKYRRESDKGAVSFSRLVEYVKERWEEECIMADKLKQALKRDPTYDEILKGSTILEELSKKKK